VLKCTSWRNDDWYPNENNPYKEMQYNEKGDMMGNLI
jgi:hypothetical protein